jgi:hypothetical protein
LKSPPQGAAMAGVAARQAMRAARRMGNLS